MHHRSRAAVVVGLLAHFLLAAGAVVPAATPPTSQPEETFRWKAGGEGLLDLYLGDRRVLRYVHAFDPSTPDRLHETYKCYHHVYDASGERPLTKGPGGLYTHHRGLFLGWNRLATGGQEYDFWHMKGVTQRHVAMLETTADAGSARQGSLIEWCDGQGVPLISEERWITVHRADDPALLLLDFESRLTSRGIEVLLDGDPEHAGFQFRAHNDVADGPADVKATYLFHRDGIDPHFDKDLPWASMSFGLNGKRYWIQHMNHPDNPTSTVYSAYRDYGRFGAFPTRRLASGETLTLRYRVVVGEGPMPARETCEERYAAFVSATATTPVPSP